MSTTKLDNPEFSHFVSQVLFATLDRLPFTFTIESERLHIERCFQTATSFIHRILRCTESTIPFPIILIALKYIDRLAQIGNQNPCYGSEGHLFLFALITAQKMHADNCYTNASWSKISKTQVHLLLKMEFEFLDSLAYDLNVGKQEYAEWYLHVQGLAKKYKATVKGCAAAAKEEAKIVAGASVEGSVMTTPEL